MSMYTDPNRRSPRELLPELIEELAELEDHVLDADVEQWKHPLLETSTEFLRKLADFRDGNAEWASLWYETAWEELHALPDEMQADFQAGWDLQHWFSKDRLAGMEAARDVKPFAELAARLILDIQAGRRCRWLDWARDGRVQVRLRGMSEEKRKRLNQYLRIHLNIAGWTWAGGGYWSPPPTKDEGGER